MRTICRLTMVILLSVWGWKTHAQFEGKIIIKVEALDLPYDLEPYRSLIESESILYIKGSKSRLETVMPGLESSITITDTLTGKVLSCIESEGQKMAMESNYKEELLDASPYFQTSFTTLNGTKKIAGFNCKNGLYTITEGPSVSTMEIWYSPEIQNVQNDAPNVPGLIMEMIMDEGDVKIRYAVSEVFQQIVPDSFFMLPEGYILIEPSDTEEDDD
ncbi:MAG TPA: hypothetical protein VIK71_06860 [Flavobacteriales bacterium]